ncbi:FUSC family protein [Kaistia adipata]|uniref:FUSC family protein n=1 Tax=Kaistia adipata TaxID=166954 RepID=UPI00041DBEE6|nr:FUSC family protein [Kaistia adipata]
MTSTPRMIPDPSEPSLPIPPPPPRSTITLGMMLQLREAKGRWPFAARAALCMGLPVVIGWAVGDTAAGLMATIGAFTAVYGSGRPYLNRAFFLALVALSFAIAVSLGVFAAETAWLVLPFITVMAAVATFLCNALRVGPPGAYLFILACAAGTAIHAPHLSIVHTGLLVLGGGALAWLAHMAGALASPRGPERRAVERSANAVATFIETVGTPAQDAARHNAALAMQDAWTTLVSYQPSRPRPDGTLSRLRAIGRELNLLFAEALDARAPIPASLAERARALGGEARSPAPGTERTDPDHVPLGHHGVLASYREALRPWSPALVVTARVGVAALIAGTIGALLGLERAYWCIAAAVLVLHQGLDWARTLQRGLERMAGTLVGLLLAGAILTVHPEGLWLAATMMALQFTIEMLVVRNYALAVVFITAAALTIASGGHPVTDVPHMLWVRGVDTVIGCLVGLIVFGLSLPRQTSSRVRAELSRTLAAIEATLAPMAAGKVTTPMAKRARRDLQHSAIALLQAYDRSIGSPSLSGRQAEQMWPAVVTTQRLAYRVLATCWALEDGGAQAAPETARALFGEDGEARLKKALLELRYAIASRTRPHVSVPVPAFLATEIDQVRDSLVAGGP